jgi:hypothetical protein
VALGAELDAARAAALERDLTEFFAGLAAEPTGRAYEYLLVLARKPVRPGR